METSYVAIKLKNGEEVSGPGFADHKSNAVVIKHGSLKRFVPWGEIENCFMLEVGESKEDYEKSKKQMARELMAGARVYAKTGTGD